MGRTRSTARRSAKTARTVWITRERGVIVRLSLRGQHQSSRKVNPNKWTAPSASTRSSNLQYVFAVTLLDGRLTFEAAHSFERMKDPRVLELKKKVTLIGDPELTRARPESQSIVQVTTRDGRQLGKRVTTFKAGRRTL